MMTERRGPLPSSSLSNPTSFDITKEELITLHSSRDITKLEEYGGLPALAKALVCYQ
jgi:hypothetical protein